MFLLQSETLEGLAGTVVVVHKQGNDASFIDLESGKVVASAPTGSGPHELVLTS